MKRFSRLCQRLESVPFTRSKAEILADYLRGVPERDASWALFLLLGGQLPKMIGPAALESWILEESELPGWLWEECREQAADFAEAVALIAQLTQQPDKDPAHEQDDARGDRDDDLPLSSWIEGRLQPLARAGEAERKVAIRSWWRTLSLDVSWAVHALALGRFPVHVSRRVADEALDLVGGRDAILGLTARLDALPAGQARSGAIQLDLFSATPNR